MTLEEARERAIEKAGKIVAPDWTPLSFRKSIAAYEASLAEQGHDLEKAETMLANIKAQIDFYFIPESDLTEHEVFSAIHRILKGDAP